MTTLRQIIIDAYREAGLVQSGLTPDADELDEGYRKLVGIIEGLYGNEMGAPLEDIPYGRLTGSNSDAAYEDMTPFIDSAFVPVNSRLIVLTEEPKTVYLDPRPDDGARFSVIDGQGEMSLHPLTVHGNGRIINGANQIVLSADRTNRHWFYRADLAEWVEVTSLEVGDQMPFPGEFDELFTTKLYKRLAARFQVGTAPETQESYREVLRKFRARYKPSKEAKSELALRQVNRKDYGQFQLGLFKNY